MPASDHINFYDKIPAHTGTLQELLVNNKLFKAVPADWSVVITDITGSTNAVLQGRHEQVNQVATGSIVTVLNIAFSKDAGVPFFFGGDGATFLVPNALLPEIMQALQLYKQYVLDQYEFDLRAGTVPVETIYSSGYTLSLAKLFRSEIFAIPVLLGDGLNYAERLIKGAAADQAEAMHEQNEPDLTGMECRWDQIPAPLTTNEIITLLIVAKDSAEQPRVFKKIMDLLDKVFGPPAERQPISIPRLKLKSTFSRDDSKAPGTSTGIWQAVMRFAFAIGAYFFFLTKKGKVYLRTLVEMSDTLVIDGRINTVITGNAGQRTQLLQFLDQMETAGEIHYGIHISGASVMSCYVRDRSSGHIHFVDGANGGYTQASRVLKGKMSGAS